MHSSFLKEWFPHRTYGYTDNLKEKDSHAAYFNFIPNSATRPIPENSPPKPQADSYAAYFNFIPNSTTRPSPENSPPKPQAVTPTHYTPPPPYDFTFRDLAFSLYGKSVVQPIDTERIQRKRRMNSHHWNGDVKRKAGYFGIHHEAFAEQTWQIPHLITRQPKLPPRDQHSDKIDIAPSNAIMSFLPEVQLCMSSLPAGELGVCSRREIPKDTVIGPYKGRRVRLEEVMMQNGANMSYLWEIYKCGKLDHYLDGSDENVSCWMRFIRSARNKEEQNLCAIQHGENIFYRTLMDVPVGTELLVWYEDKYEEYLGIPIVLHNDNQKSSQQETRNPPLETRNPPHLAYQPLRREPFTPAMLKTMERTRLWIDERLGVNCGEDEDETVGNRLLRHDSFDDDSSVPGSHNSDGETRCTTPEDIDSHLWRCSQCQQSFNQRSALRIHVCSTQTNKPFDCGHCSLSFADPNALRSHVGTHTNDRLFKCGYCGRRFAGATTLTNHIRTHTGEKPFSCEKCGKNFSQASQLSRHQRITGDCI